MVLITEFLIWSLAVFGTVNIIAVSTIMSSFRKWVIFKNVQTGEVRKNQFFGKLISCPMCLGWWVGGFWGYFIWSPSFNIMLFPDNNSLPFRILFDCFTASIVSWMLYLLIFDKQSKM